MIQKEKRKFVKKGKGERKGSETPYREANIRKPSERRNAYAAYTYAFLQREIVAQRSIGTKQV